MRRLFLLALIPLAASSALAQAPDFGGKAQIEKLKALDFLVGDWKGTGWYQAGPRRMDIKCSEKVALKASGAVLAVEGFHTMDAGGREIPIHDAYAMIYWSPDLKAYRFKAHLANGLQNEFELKPNGKGYTWENEMPQLGKVRYTMTLTAAGEWKEIGEHIVDGKWTQYFEMVLKKVP